VLPGASAVALETVAAPGTGRLVVTNDPPIIPAATGDNGLGAAMSSLTKVANTIGNLPLREIGDNMRNASQRLNTLLGDPALNESVQRLNRSMTEVERITKTVGQNIDPTVKSLRNAAESAESTAATAKANVEPIVQSLRNAAESAEAAAKRAQELVGTSQKQGYDVSELIRELTRAAEAVRALADYLTENPDAVIKGRRE
jgi:methyl-accepting chemotaxis protein